MCKCAFAFANRTGSGFLLFSALVRQLRVGAQSDWLWHRCIRCVRRYSAAQWLLLLLLYTRYMPVLCTYRYYCVADVVTKKFWIGKYMQRENICQLAISVLISSTLRYSEKYHITVVSRWPGTSGEWFLSLQKKRAIYCRTSGGVWLCWSRSEVVICFHQFVLSSDETYQQQQQQQHYARSQNKNWLNFFVCVCRKIRLSGAFLRYFIKWE